MYKNKNLKKSFEDSPNSEDDFDFCNTETGQKFAIKWSPTEDIKFISKHRVSGTRSLGRSATRRKRNLFQYKINRSLNFEIGTSRNDRVFKSPNFDSDDSPVCNEKYLTRSAKILRSLHINFSPSNTRNKRINKALNFDLSPSPKRIFSSSESIFNKESPKIESNINRISRINKSLNFSSSSNGSHFSSYLDSSVESIDENQNQTPSHRSRSVKKSLNYLTPSPKPNANILRSVDKTPMSRQKFISDLKYNAETPDTRIIKESEKKSQHFDGINVSTPRNLFHDFEEDDKDMRPFTPENVMQFVPESMSAIKKSHKKQRQGHNSEKLYMHQHCSKTESSSEDPIILSHSGERPATPITNDSYPSPNYSAGSIKQSHKKDKSKKKSAIIHSEDEISDSGSIFDYTELLEKKPDPGNHILGNSSLLSSGSSGFARISFKEDDEKRPTCLDNSMEELSDHGSLFDYSERIETQTDMNLRGHLQSQMDLSDRVNNDYDIRDKEPLKLSLKKLELISPVKVEARHESGCSETGQNEGRSVTPENVINVLEQVMSDSIKKSHKKIKDKNKKTLFKSQASIQEPTESLSSSSVQEVNQALNAACNSHTPENVARAGTPENVNSSRMLLGQYSSVKKSHKKNKHKKIVTESAKRQRYFHNNHQRQTPKDACHVNGVKSLLSPSNSSATNSTKRRKSIHNELIIGAVTGLEICCTTPDKRFDNDHSVESSAAADKSPLERSTPNKRKKSFSLNEMGTSISSVDSSNNESSSMDYESTEEEFKIFTPIKKRRSLQVETDIRGTETTSLELNASQSLELADQNCAKQNKCFMLIENRSATPTNYSESSIARKEDDSASKTCGEAYDNGNANGRSTPQNQSTSEMIFDINSIKKSHKKDKKISRLRRTSIVDADKKDFEVINYEEPDENCKPPSCYQTVTPNNSSSENIFENPQPSTSISSTWTDVKPYETTNIEQTKTPPNCAKVINFLKLRQADSIKRSHKKIREQKRHSLIKNDPDLSDDGSIFDSSDRVGSNEFNDLADDIGAKNRSGSNSQSTATDRNVEAAPEPLPQTPPNTSKLIEMESIKKSHKKVREFKRKGEQVDVVEDLSEDGSIFDPEERLDKSINDVNKVSESRESPP